MTLLIDKKIDFAVQLGLLKIEPYNPEDVQPVSVDLHLHLPGKRSYEKYDYKRNCPKEIDPEDPENTQGLQDTLLKEFTLRSGVLLIARTKEWIELPANFAAQIEGLSSLGRLGLNVYQTCGLVDPGFRGYITLEITSAVHPIILRDGMRIAQIMFHDLKHEVQKPYDGKYQDQTGAWGSRGN